MKKTKLYDRHVSLNAKIIDFHGWLLPVSYTDILKETLAVRRNVGLFDISHMGKFKLSGLDVIKQLNWFLPGKFSKLKNYSAVYTQILNDNAGIIDDIIVYQKSEDCFYIIVNASRKDADLEWFKKTLPKNIELEDLTNGLSMIAIQGRLAENIVSEVFKKDFSKIKKFNFDISILNSQEIFVLRTGYTGEDGFELVIPDELVEGLWDELLKKCNGCAVGLGALDVLRIEAGYPLYGQELEETINPLEANINWSLDLLKDFKTKSILKEQLDTKKYLHKNLVGFDMIDKGVPRFNDPIFFKDQKIGYVSSGTYSPMFNKFIGMGFIDKEKVGNNADLFIKSRDVLKKAVITDYRRFLKK